MKISDLKIESIYNHSDLVETFQCGNMGGMRRSRKTNTLLLICDHTKGLYDDVWYEDVLHYTGMGKVGDQVLKGNQNKTLYESGSNGIRVYLFEVLEPAKYIYRGEVKLVDKPYQNTQPDDNGNMRKVWMFPIKPIQKGSFKTPEKYTISDANVTSEVAASLADDILKKAALHHGKNKVLEKQVTMSQRERDSYVSEYVKRRACGVCDLCKSAAPFKDKNGRPYLESHHVIWLANDGADTIDNAVALCPNCHRKMHSLNLPDDVKKLSEKLSEYKRKNM